MKYASFLLTGVFCSISLLSSPQIAPLDKKVRQILQQVDSNNIKRDITYLADDRLKGRLPGQPGYQIAVDYVTDQFKQIGLLPGGENGTFLQKLVLRKATIDDRSATVVLKDQSGNEDMLVVGKEIYIVPNPVQPSVKVAAPLVFAGYGLDIPGKYSDYAGMDVKGKIVVILAGTPAKLVLPSTLNAHFANLGSKINIAAAKGAIGVIFVQPVLSPGSTTTVAMDPEKTTAYSRTANNDIAVVARISRPVLQRLFMYTGKNLTTIFADLNEAKPSSFPLMGAAAFQYASTYEDIESYNVAGKIEGSDPRLKDEYVVHTAHLDHVGIGNPVKGDSIYNGAHDNASGVASLLEIARTYKRLKTKPRRSILIVMVTAEEMGLLGSAYFAAHPTVPQAKIVADVNTDMPTLIAPLLSVAPLGAEHSSLEQNVIFAGKELGIEVQKDPMPEEVRFVRSDQYSFVLQGIPALHTKYGIKTADPAFDLVKYTKEWRDANYHKPSDEITNGFDFTAARKYVQLNFLISYSIAQTTARPTWNKGDFFEPAAK
ncbi:M20/M25/M40 family metallo-hydrolase [Paraflavitalea soli]|uniref:M20/M25/M40 family metallo-hydrolase n=1 Tax=Paraflavitalea soli TaxID=2315862 RepID=A0A3B7MNC2_9BACT|nr:M28 family peptidase [Paraflavitalea soli]AXY74530.1 M20/M25/M40 family metallo-hydrolase [Paraflavitalea soli]